MLGRTFFGGATGWNGRTSALTEAQTKSIARTSGQLPPAAGLTAPVILDAQDEILLAEVRRDGRVPATDLAAALGCSQPAASRRLDRLVASGALFFDVEIVPEHLGYQVEALLWVTVAPGRLEEVASATAAGDLLPERPYGVCNIPVACNRATADFLISSPLMGQDHQGWDPASVQARHDQTALRVARPADTFRPAPGRKRSARPG